MRHTPQTVSALVAEDEPLLAQSLVLELARAWPELKICALVSDGASATQQALQLTPDVLFLDIQMPQVSGLQAALNLADAWSDTHPSKPLPLIVFVTAYDQYALQAFETQAIDYVLKPVRAQRLAKTVARLQTRLSEQSRDCTAPDLTAVELHRLMQASTPAASRLQWIQASKTSASGSTIQMIAIDDVIYFEAADKYIRVLTQDNEYLIRTPLKDLLPQLDPAQFWQIHRGTVVRVSGIAWVQRDEFFKVSLKLRQRPETLAVSRLYAHLFKAM